ncbi:unnamed protein product, partial [Ectocarpus sp. 8 AP-2014]
PLQRRSAQLYRRKIQHNFQTNGAPQIQKYEGRGVTLEDASFPVFKTLLRKNATCASFNESHVLEYTQGKQVLAASRAVCHHGYAAFKGYATCRRNSSVLFSRRIRPPSRARQDREVFGKLRATNAAQRRIATAKYKTLLV